MPEILAIIRRMSTHCDARVSLEEFANFIGEPLHKESRPFDSKDPNPHRAQDFQTSSRLDANVERSIIHMHQHH